MNPTAAQLQRDDIGNSKIYTQNSYQQDNTSFGDRGMIHPSSTSHPSTIPWQSRTAEKLTTEWAEIFSKIGSKKNITTNTISNKNWKQQRIPTPSSYQSDNIPFWWQHWMSQRLRMFYFPQYKWQASKTRQIGPK
jgi:hypothetical protein